MSHVSFMHVTKFEMRIDVSRTRTDITNENRCEARMRLHVPQMRIIVSRMRIDVSRTRTDISRTRLDVPQMSLMECTPESFLYQNYTFHHFKQIFEKKFVGNTQKEHNLEVGAVLCCYTACALWYTYVMCKCIYIWIYIYVSICIHIHTYIWSSYTACAQWYTYICVNIYVYIRMYG